MRYLGNLSDKNGFVANSSFLLACAVTARSKSPFGNFGCIITSAKAEYYALNWCTSLFGDCLLVSCSLSFKAVSMASG